MCKAKGVTLKLYLSEDLTLKKSRSSLFESIMINIWLRIQSVLAKIGTTGELEGKERISFVNNSVTAFILAFGTYTIQSF